MGVQSPLKTHPLEGQTGPRPVGQPPPCPNGMAPFPPSRPLGLSLCSAVTEEMPRTFPLRADLMLWPFRISKFLTVLPPPWQELVRGPG